jgi:hypothetical protein
MKIKTTINKLQNAYAFFVAFIFTFLLSATPAFAQGQEWSEGVCVVTARGQQVATLQGLQCLIGNILGVAVTLIGIAAFGIFVISSVQIMLSGGNSKGLESAKGSMTYAVVGIVVALSAFIILNLISQFTGINFTTFSIPGPSS